MPVEIIHFRGSDEILKEKNLDRDVEQLEESDSTEIKWMLDRVKALESRFAATHPVLERMARELADAIVKMGI